MKNLPYLLDLETRLLDARLAKSVVILHYAQKFTEAPIAICLCDVEL